MTCKHKDHLPLYGRDQKSGSKQWISSQSVCSTMIYMCLDCGAILQKKMVERKILTIKKEVNKNG